jgi:outer membrane lipoprotein SlyB
MTISSSLAIASALAGVAAGNTVEQGVTRMQSPEITVKLDSGGLRAITDKADEAFRLSERMRLLSGSGVTCVTH